MTQAENDPAYWLREYGPKLRAYALQITRCHASAEDVLQEAFVSFWRRRESVREPMTYLYRSVRNMAMNWRRSESRRRGYEGSAPPGRGVLTPAAAAERAERHEHIRGALAGLPQSQREVVALKVWSDMTFDQISAVMSIPRSTAHATYRTAMGVLYERLDEEA